MIINLYLLIILISHTLFLQANDYATVFVHLGPSPIPAYTLTALEQFRLFNPSSPLYLIAPQKSLNTLSVQLKKYNTLSISAESLPQTPHHVHFLNKSTLDRYWEQGFWRYTTERFFYIEELMIQKNLTCIFHIENDVMVYRNLGELLPTLRQHYHGIAMTFGWDRVGVPGFMYIPSLNILQKITHYMSLHAHQGKDDGILLAQLKDEQGPNCIDYLPVIFPEYAHKYPLINAGGVQAQNAQRFYQFIDQFPGIFDAGAIGQYLGGIAPRNGSLPPGYINTHCIFNVQRLTFTWERDTQGRKIPYVKFGNVVHRINNLHVHSKKLEGFRS